MLPAVRVARAREAVERLLGIRPESPPEPLTLVRVTVANTGRDLLSGDLVAAIRPYGPNGQRRWVEAIEADGGALSIGKRLALVAQREPAGVVAGSASGADIYAALRDRPATPRVATTEPTGTGTVALRFPMSLAPGASDSVVLVLPMSSVSDQSARRLRWLRAVDFDGEAERSRASWQAAVRHVEVRVPDERYSNAFYASLAYLVAQSHDGNIRSGPFAHNAMWYRDAAYVLTALQKGGIDGPTRLAIPRLLAGQMPSGELPAALDPTGRSRFHERHEWDAQGQLAYLVAETYRLSGDRGLAEYAYQSVARAMRFAVAMSESTRTPANAGTPYYGLMPPGDSAEDLGPREWHHYWDSFWTIGGLREAAFLARELGHAEDSAWFDREADELRSLVDESIALVQRQSGIDYVPNAPEDVRSSAMARGTTPAVWPLGVYPSSDGRIRASFSRYDELWVRPHANAYLHNSGNYWVYGGLGLAHAQMILGEAGRAAEMAQWAIDNQTAPGTFAWAEAVRPDTKRFAGGDMPHSWAAAEWVLYLRDALLREDGDRLVLADAVPAPWMQDGRRVEIHGAPTRLGTAGYALESRQSDGYWDLSIDAETSAPGGYILRGPFPSAPVRVNVDGRDATPDGKSAVSIPAGARMVRVYFR